MIFQVSNLNTLKPNLTQYQSPQFFGPNKKRIKSGNQFFTEKRKICANLEFSQIAIAAPVLVGLAVYAGARFYSYSQMEVATAGMLTNWVPRGGARVIQIGGGTRQLYYYPKDTVLVTVVGPDVNVDLIQQAGMQAAVPTIAKKQKIQELLFQEAGSVDAVVILDSFQTVENIQKFLSEIARVLKKGCPMIIIQQIEGGVVPQFIAQNKKVQKNQLIEQLKSQSKEFEEFQYDIAVEQIDPHVVGFAKLLSQSAGKSKKKGFQKV
eukprot:TRINITY_DN20056_c0_g1_i1.p1 TRINITY_DN20056_c0_g1~~TRINITY_DN20056_c0_g1_i1.p1  ORF type:complete len:265 (+),score=24.16 TRINITY_DN20056_c0_g1_i1:65-859(+)